MAFWKMLRLDDLPFLIMVILQKQQIHISAGSMFHGMAYMERAGMINVTTSVLSQTQFWILLGRRSAARWTPCVLWGRKVVEQKPLFPTSQWLYNNITSIVIAYINRYCTIYQYVQYETYIEWELHVKSRDHVRTFFANGSSLPPITGSGGRSFSFQRAVSCLAVGTAMGEAEDRLFPETLKVGDRL